jgi:hypothetical protein
MNLILKNKEKKYISACGTYTRIPGNITIVAIITYKSSTMLLLVPTTEGTL